MTNKIKSEVLRLKISFSGILFGLISAAIGFFFLTGAWGAYLDYSRVKDYSARASGQVIKKHSQVAADGSGNYYLDYWFLPANGSKINATCSISKQQWEALKADDNIEIRYDPANPNRSIPIYGSSPSLIMACFILVLGVVFIAFGCSRFLTSFKKKKSSA